MLIRLRPTHTSPGTHAFYPVYYSQVDGQESLGIKPDGSVEYGPKYDLETEAKKLAEMAKRYAYTAWGEPEPFCRDAGYEPLDRGMRRVFPGTAFPIPPITEQGT